MSQVIDTVSVSMAMDIETVKSNVAQSKYKYKDLSDFPDWKEDKSIAIVAGGPSLKQTIETLRNNKYHNILVCGSAHDYLYDNGIPPTMCIVCDPDPISATYLKRANNYSTTYFIATQCDKAVFDRFHCLSKVYTFNAGGDDAFNKIFDMGTFLKGGCTVGTRAIMLALGMGYTQIELFGFDTCILEDAHHAYEFNDPSETIGKINEISLVPGGRVFKMADYMVGQLFDIKQILIANYARMNLVVHGDGVIAEYFNIIKSKVSELGISPK